MWKRRPVRRHKGVVEERKMDLAWLGVSGGTKESVSKSAKE